MPNQKARQARDWACDVSNYSNLDSLKDTILMEASLSYITTVMHLVWTVPNWFTNLVSILFIIAIVIVLILDFNSWRKRESE